MSNQRQTADRLKPCGHAVGYACCCHAQDVDDRTEDVVQHLRRRWRTSPQEREDVVES